MSSPYRDVGRGLKRISTKFRKKWWNSLKLKSVLSSESTAAFLSSMTFQRNFWVPTFSMLGDFERLFDLGIDNRIVRRILTRLGNICLHLELRLKMTNEPDKSCGHEHIIYELIDAQCHFLWHLQVSPLFWLIFSTLCGQTREHEEQMIVVAVATRLIIFVCHKSSFVAILERFLCTKKNV